MSAPPPEAPRVEPDETVGVPLARRERAHVYRLLAHLLATEPTSGDLRVISALRGDASQLGKAVAELAEAARTTDPGAARVAFNRLFIGLGAGEVVPYASSYIAGSLHDVPLIHLRESMRRLGIRRAAGNREPEDHVSTILDMMAGLIDEGLSRQRLDAGRTFARHVAPWMPRLFADLRKRARALPSPLYVAVAELGSVFIDDERVRLGRNAAA